MLGKIQQRISTILGEEEKKVTASRIPLLWKTVKLSYGFITRLI